MSYVIEIKNLSKSFEQQKVLKNIDFNVEEGSLISLIGSSGCGKTTLLRNIAMIEYPDNGDITVGDTTISKAEFETFILKNQKFLRKKSNINVDWADLCDVALRRKIKEIRVTTGFLFQDLNLFPNKTVLENMTLAPVIVSGRSKDEAVSESERILEKVDMKQFKDRYPHELSGGQSQRAAIARSLAMNPKIMLYDEPTSALDPALALEVLNIMKELKNDGMTQIVVTHAINFAKNVSDKVAYMHNGEIIECNSPDIIFNNPADSRTQDYLKVL